MYHYVKLDIFDIFGNDAGHEATHDSGILSSYSI